MRKWIRAAVFGAAIMPNPAAADSDCADAAPAGSLFVQASALNLRAQPDAAAESLLKLPIGTAVTPGPEYAIDTRNGERWQMVIVGAPAPAIGWVPARFLASDCLDYAAAVARYEAIAADDHPQRLLWARRAYALAPQRPEAWQRLKSVLAEEAVAR